MTMQLVSLASLNRCPVHNTILLRGQACLLCQQGSSQTLRGERYELPGGATIEKPLPPEGGGNLS
jgi:hypothetical protein